MLTNPLRKPTPFEIWSPDEIALFEACMCKYGPVFSHYSRFIRTKTSQEIVDFFFAWKKSTHYQTWSKKEAARIS